MKKFFILLTTLSLLFGVLLNAQDPKVYLSVYPKKINSGQKLTLSINIETLKRVKVKYPEVDKVSNLPVVSIRDKKRNILKDINGSKVSVVRISRDYTVIPKKTLTVPSFSVGVDGKVYKTQPHKVRVLAKKRKKIVFRMRSSKKEVVVGEPFIVKVELIESIALSSANIDYLAPEFKDFSVTSLGGGKTIQKGNSLIRTIRYLLQPKSAGKFMLDPATAKIDIQTVPVPQSPFAFFGDENQIKTITTNKLDIDVKPLPQNVDLIGNYRIKAAVDKTTRSAQKPISYTLTITGRGNIENLKDIKFSIPNVTIYPKDPKIEHIANKKGVESRYKREYVFIAQHDFVIPSLEFKEYNLEKKVVDTLKTKPIKIHIKEAESITSVLHNQITNSAAINQNSVNKETNINKTSQSSTSKSKVTSKEEKLEKILIDKNYYKRLYSKEKGYSLSAIVFTGLYTLIFGFAAGWYLPRVLEKIKNKKNKKRETIDLKEAFSTLYPHTTKNREIEEMVKNLYEVNNGNYAIRIDIKKLEKMLKEIKGE